MAWKIILIALILTSIGVGATALRNAIEDDTEIPDVQGDPEE